MNVEAAAQFLDALAFLLVTPEFLGEQTLGSIRSHLTKGFEFLMSKYISIGSIVLSIMVSLIVIIGIGTFPLAGREFLLMSRPIVVISGVILAFVALFAYSWVIVGLAAMLAVRRILFGVGVVLFFLARGISVWHAWGTGG
jgi:hypothetical protein